VLVHAHSSQAQAGGDVDVLLEQIELLLVADQLAEALPGLRFDVGIPVASVLVEQEAQPGGVPQQLRCGVTAEQLPHVVAAEERIGLLDVVEQLLRVLPGSPQVALEGGQALRRGPDVRFQAVVPDEIRELRLLDGAADARERPADPGKVDGG
jgi:hypothetical protein